MGTAVLEGNRISRRIRQIPRKGLVLNKEKQQNRVVIENGEVRPLLFTETIELEEARALLHEVVRLEYSLP